MFQVKRILPSGAAAQSGQLQVGDRLISCNGRSLRGLTQNHCLAIIRDASAQGDISFQVIRPVYHGNSMEISVTLNSGVNDSKTKNYSSNFDPSQFSVKSQSYDQQAVDVVVTSESEDYLTVSEDEYSRIGRLANIPASEANQVFVSNKFRLAYQTSQNQSEEESSTTDTEGLQQDIEHSNSAGVDIVDLTKVDSSGHHIPSFQRSTRDQVVPQRNLDTLDVDIPSSRSPLPSSDLDQVSPRSPVPYSYIDEISSQRNTQQKIHPERDHHSYSAPNQRHYPEVSVNDNIPESDSEVTRFNPLYEDSNASDFTDTEQQDIYIQSPLHGHSDLDNISLASNRTLTRTDLDNISVGSYYRVEGGNNNYNSEEISVPPPEEFSDNTVTIPIDHSGEQSLSYEEELDSAKLAFNSELTAPFDSVLQEYPQSTEARGEHYYDNSDEEIDSDSDDRVHVNHIDRSGYIIERFTPSKDSIMDAASESMLNNALNIEYDSKLHLGKDEVVDFDDPAYINNNIVAENIALDILQQETGGVKYCLENDDQPDEFPEADQPEEVPDLPDAPPPVAFGGQNNVTLLTVNGEACGEFNDNNGDDDDDIVVPVTVQRKVNIPVNFVNADEEVEVNEGIMSESVSRSFQLPQDFQEKEIESIDTDSKLEDLVTITSLTSTRENNHQDSDSGEEVEEEEIKPVEIENKATKHLVNVISVVNAFKNFSKDKDPDEVDVIVKEDATDKPKSFANAVIKVGSKTNETGKQEVESSPPKEEKIETEKDKITFSSIVNVESSPPKAETVESEREIITRPKVQNKPEMPEQQSEEQRSPVLKSSVNVVSQHKTPEPKPLVPPLDLQTNDNCSDKIEEKVPSPVYKTTIGVPKADSPKESTQKLPSENSDKSVSTSEPKQAPQVKPTPQLKSLSQIKPLSFNPKSLSTTGPRSAQYKTTISTLGTKPTTLTRPLAGSQKPDYPIKRMETLPFEVSILKGILGIGIKTQMTPEGHVQVIEILPNGPVGREGNIK